MNKFIKKHNRGRVGGGARWCKHARPKLEHEPVVQPKTQQTSIGSFFSKAA